MEWVRPCKTTSVTKTTSGKDAGGEAPVRIEKKQFLSLTKKMNRYI
jgi:hypothetical protein